MKVLRFIRVALCLSLAAVCLVLHERSAVYREVFRFTTASGRYVSVESEACELYLHFGHQLEPPVTPGFSFTSLHWVGGRENGWEFYYDVTTLVPGLHAFGLNLAGVTLAGPAWFFAINYTLLAAAAIALAWPKMLMSLWRAARRAPGKTLIYVIAVLPFVWGWESAGFYGLLPVTLGYGFCVLPAIAVLLVLDLVRNAVMQNRPWPWQLAEKRRIRRVLRGECIECGYDLRGSSERCPECGLVINKAQRARIGARGI